MIYIIIFILLIVIVGLSLILRNLLNKNEDMEDFIIGMHEQTIEVINNMRELDKMEMFEQDDEVGVIFTQLLNVINEYAHYVDVGEE